MADTNQKKANGFFRFFKETKAEMKKVTWPNKKQLMYNTIIILVFIIITCAILSVCDIAFSKILELFTKKL